MAKDFVIDNGWLTDYDRAITHLVLPPEVKHVEDGLFIGSDLESIVIPEGWTHIPGEMFFECFKLKNITLPSTLECIGSHAFFGCINLRTISLPESLKEIRFSAFAESGLEEVTLPSNMKEIGAWAFKGAPYLKKVTFPSSPVTLEYDTFLRCSKLDTLEGVPSFSEENISRRVGACIPHTELTWWDAKFIFRDSPIGDSALSRLEELEKK